MLEFGKAKNKKGLIRIIEAFSTILIITGVMLIFLNKGYISKTDNSQKIYDMEQGIFRQIQLNDSLRADVLGISNLPVGIDSFPSSLKNIIESNIPGNLECDAEICGISSNCITNSSIQKDVYVQSSVISSDLNTYNPRQIKISCWTK